MGIPFKFKQMKLGTNRVIVTAFTPKEITADEAREKSLNNNKEDMTDVYTKIRGASEKGEMSIIYGQDLSDASIDILTNKGFDVSLKVCMPEYWYSITWFENKD
jgi:hypothetical protein